MMDEPSLGVAPLVVRDIYQTIAALKRDGLTILLVEQNARAALAVASGYLNDDTVCSDAVMRTAFYP